MTGELQLKLGTLAETPVLLVAADYDGTLSPIVSDPAAASPEPRSIRAIRALAELPHTHASIISGRSIEQLHRFTEDAGRLHLVGMHGIEWPGNPIALSDTHRALLEDLEDAVRTIVEAHPGASIERKPAGIAGHYRNVADAHAPAFVDALLNGPGAVENVFVRHGSRVVELMVLPASKGRALAEVRRRVGASAALFVGDDITDEDALASLGPVDLGIKVGTGETVATFRVTDTTSVAEVLEELLRLRQEWLSSRVLAPLDRCGVLTDQRVFAVVSPGARISWLTVPQIDSSSIFAELVGGTAGGHFSIQPAEDAEAESNARYDGDCFTLLTEWPGLRVTDCLDCSGGRAFQKPGRTDLLRLIDGTSKARVIFAPRLDFGRTPTRILQRDGGLEVEDSAEPIVLRSPGITWSIFEDGPHQTAEAVVDPGHFPSALELRYGTGSLRATSESTAQRFALNRAFWAGWAGSLSLPGIADDVVKRSALVLKSLSFGPTGAIVAAATTSLPEHLGGQRNWDYRFCWPRDASIIAGALVRLGNTGHALRFLDWMLGVVDRIRTPERLRPIYTVNGADLPPEAEIGQLCGYGGSRPVRINNAAASQVQLDEFGPIADLAARLAERGAPLAPDHWRLVMAMVQAVEARWEEPDHGIWEMRIERRHHVHSKAMCWHTVQRALVLEDHLYGTQNPAWVSLRERIRADVITHAWSDRLGSLTGAYGHEYLDAGTLVVGLTGLIAPADERFVRTVEMIDRHLRRGATVYRYTIDDGLPGAEGGMHLCTGWLIESLALIGRCREARSLFDELVALVKPPGIMSEQYEPRYALALGNLAQGYSHAAVINAAIALAHCTPTPTP